MQKKGRIRRYLAVPAVLASCSLFAGAAADKKEAPRPLPPEIVKAWRDAGADVGWMKNLPPQPEDGYGYWVPWREKGAPGAAPAFRFHPESSRLCSLHRTETHSICFTSLNIKFRLRQKVWRSISVSYGRGYPLCRKS